MLSSSPDIKLDYSPVGRETLEAIASELIPDIASEPKPRARLESGPEIVIGQSAVGRETLAAIEAELAPPRARSSRPPRAKPSQRAGRRELVNERERPNEDEEKTLPRARLPAAKIEPVEIFEMLTFVVKNAQTGDLSTEAQRFAFVGERLRAGLGNHSLESVARIDVTPWTERGTIIVRVWCRL